MKKPVIKDYCKPFSLDNRFVSFDAKKYAKEAEKYIEQQSKGLFAIVELLDNKEAMGRKLNSLELEIRFTALEAMGNIDKSRS